MIRRSTAIPRDDGENGAINTTLPAKNSKVPDMKIREMPIKKVSRVTDVRKNNEAKNNFTGVLDTDP